MLTAKLMPTPQYKRRKARSHSEGGSTGSASKQLLPIQSGPTSKEKQQPPADLLEHLKKRLFVLQEMAAKDVPWNTLTELDRKAKTQSVEQSRAARKLAGQDVDETFSAEVAAQSAWEKGLNERVSPSMLMQCSFILTLLDHRSQNTYRPWSAKCT